MTHVTGGAARWWPLSDEAPPFSDEPPETPADAAKKIEPAAGGPKKMVSRLRAKKVEPALAGPPT